MSSCSLLKAQIVNLVIQFKKSSKKKTTKKITWRTLSALPTKENKNMAVLVQVHFQEEPKIISIYIRSLKMGL